MPADLLRRNAMAVTWSGRVGSVGLVTTTLAVENYRSPRSLIVGLAPLTVVTGANGTGKSSLFRALRLLVGATRITR